MRPTKNILIGLGGFLALVLAALIAVPAFFGDSIAARVLAEVNRSVNAHVAWSDASLSLLRGFPNVTLSLDRLTMVGLAPFEGDTLVSVRDARLILNLGSVVGYVRNGRPIIV